MRTLSVMLFAAVMATAPANGAEAGFRIEKTLKLEPRGRFLLESDTGSVTLSGGSPSGVRIVVTSSREDLESVYSLSFEENPGSARVTVHRKDGSGWFEHASLHFEIVVPSPTQTEIRTAGGSIQVSGVQGDAVVQTSGGSIDVSGLSGKLDAKTSGGQIHLQEVDGDARVETSGGGITVAALDGSLRAHTSGGSIRVDRVTGCVEATTSGGSIDVNFGRGNACGGVLETSGGSIQAALDRSANLEIDASTSGGSVSTDLPVRVLGQTSRSSLRGSLGSGGQTLRLHTSGGSIRVRAL